jgi:hypothetical protein
MAGRVVAGPEAGNAKGEGGKEKASILSLIATSGRGAIQRARRRKLVL